MTKDFYLSPAQQLLVQDNLKLVISIVRHRFLPNESVVGMSQEDLIQEGFLWLYQAAATYHPGPASFSTYAYKVVHNGFLSHCRKITQHQNVLLPLTGDNDFGATICGHPMLSDALSIRMAELEIADLLHCVCRNYSNASKRCVEVLILRAQGLTNPEIALQYGVSPKHISAWISKAAAKLRTDPELITAIQK